MAAEVLTRLIMSVIQVILLLVVSLLLFHFDLTGNVAYMLIAAALGGAIFIALGYVIAAISKSEDAVPAIGNLVILPMMFLSGVFFPTDSVPSWLRVVSDRLPLTYLNDALRKISVDNQTFFDPRIQWDMVWMAVWLAVMAFLAIRVFRWE
jgi:ABC-2 type transport system permease protein